MDIFLLDRNGGLVDLWQQYFSEDNVMPVRGFFDVFMDPYDVQCVVSPANSYGIMDGGYDGAITRYFGDGLQRCVQDHIINHYYGEQPVGTSFMVDIPGSDKKLIHTPTMRAPSAIADPLVVYRCMRTTLMCALNNRVESIVIPAFGGATGNVPYRSIAALMKELGICQSLFGRSVQGNVAAMLACASGVRNHPMKKAAVLVVNKHWIALCPLSFAECSFRSSCCGAYREYRLE